MPDIGEIKDICKYVVAYTGKRNHTSQQEKTAIQDLITGWVSQKNLQIVKKLHFTHCPILVLMRVIWEG